MWLRINVCIITALQYLWGPGDYKLEIEEMQMEQASLKGQQSKSLLDLLRDTQVRSQCLCLFILFEAIQFCGIGGVNIPEHYFYIMIIYKEHM